MDELGIQTHNFENAKNELKKFSEQPVMGLEFNKVNDSKGVGEFFLDLLLNRGIGLNHKVTGEELNELTSKIQTHLLSINKTNIQLIQEFGQVYSALEALDKDYIKAILISINAAKATSESIQKTQGQINKIVENQMKTLEELKKFKQKWEGYAHLGDIDKIWNIVEEHTSYLIEIKKRDEGLFAVIQKNKEETDEKIADAVQKTNTAVGFLPKRIKYAYLIAVGSAALAIIELILLLVKVI